MGVPKGKENAMISWVGALAIALLVIGTGLPAALRVLALLRAAPSGFETHGAANDPRY
jgi:hypothetical protein